jgi:H+/Cl- antiporter ClcA
MCEAPACDPQPLFSIMPTHQALASALVMLIFLGIPIGLLAYAIVRRWFKSLPPE